jgi:hypothetical protein
MAAPAPTDPNYDAVAQGTPVNIVNDEGLGAEIVALANAVTTIKVAINALTAKISP